MKFFTLIILLSISTLSFSQVGIGTTNPDSSSALEVESTNSGMLMPRMTQAERDAIVSPANSLLIYQTDNTPGFYYYDSVSSSWLPLVNTTTTTTATTIIAGGIITIKDLPIPPCSSFFTDVSNPNATTNTFRSIASADVCLNDGTTTNITNSSVTFFRGTNSGQNTFSADGDGSVVAPIIAESLDLSYFFGGAFSFATNVGFTPTTWVGVVESAADPLNSVNFPDNFAVTILSSNNNNIIVKITRVDRYGATDSGTVNCWSADHKLTLIGFQ